MPFYCKSLKDLPFGFLLVLTAMHSMVLRPMVCIWSPVMARFPNDAISSAYYGALVSSHSSLPRHHWIIDFNTSHHMTSMSSIFSSYCLALIRDKVYIVDGSLSFVASTGCITFTSSLSSVFHAPNFQLNLVSIRYIIKALNCSVTVFSFLLCFPRLGDRENDC